MNLLMLILIFLGVATGAAVFYFAWRLSSGEPRAPSSAEAEKEEPDARKE